MKPSLILISDRDNVAVATRDLKDGETLSLLSEQITIKQDIPFGHKVAVRDIAAGENIIKYGMPIGHATTKVSVGDHVHTHNLKTNLSGLLEYSYQKQPNPILPANDDMSFMGYKRKDGSVGVRNEIWIIPTVGCVNTTAQILAKQAAEELADKVDGVYAFTHDKGCSQLGDDQAYTQKILKGLIQHPNAAGVLVLSLGCENNNLGVFQPLLGNYDSNRVKFLITQNVQNEYEEAMKLLRQLGEYASGFKREKCPLSALTLGFKCGGSDAFSGITANPLCGRVNDLLVSRGGSTILTEVPEMFGAETLLMNRAHDEATFHKIVNMINDFKNYFTRYQQTIYENPSPGNKKGGISSLEEKSLGCTQKGGQSEVVDVLAFGERVQKHGLNLLTGPGNDQVSTTNLTAAGAQIILFTTGRGNPFGAPVPTVKISSNTPLYENKKHWIDYNAGAVLEGLSLEQASEELFHFILDIASGKVKTKNEIYGYKEISIFKDGVVL